MVNEMELKRMNIFGEYEEGIKLATKEYNNSNNTDRDRWVLCYHLSLFHNKLKNKKQATYYIDKALRYVEEGLIDEIECVITIWQMIEVKKNSLELFELINAYTELRNHLKTIILDSNNREMISIDIEIAIINNKLDEVLRLLNMAVELNYIDVVEFTKEDIINSKTFSKENKENVLTFINEMI